MWSMLDISIMIFLSCRAWSPSFEFRNIDMPLLCHLHLFHCNATVVATSKFFMVLLGSY